MRMSVVVLILLSGVAVRCPAAEGNFLSQRASLTVMPLYQHWSLKGGTSFSQTSVALSAYYPLAPDLSISLRGAQASSGGDLTKINSLTDTQVLVQYHLEVANVLLSCGVNFPSGKRELTQDEFSATLLLSNEVFNLQVPNYGQGVNVNPGFTWAIPIGDDIAIGVGAAYQYKGKFKPLAGSDEYDPGEEILVAGGIDVRLSEAAIVAGDVVFTTYGKDKLGGQEVFAAGNRWAANVQFRHYFDQDELSLLVRYRSRGKNEVAVRGSLVPEVSKVSPNQFELLGQYRVHFSERVSSGFQLEGRFYEKTAAPLSGTTLFGAGIAPEISISRNVSVLARMKYGLGTAGDDSKLSGYEAGLGLGVTF